jgi:hypothetical protein
MSDIIDTGTVISPNTNGAGDVEKDPEIPAGKTFDAEYVKELRDQAAKYRTERNAERTEREAREAALAEAQAKVKEFEKEKLTAEERAKLEFDESKTLNQTLLDKMKSVQLEASVAKNVVNYSLADVDATLKLMDTGSVQYGDDGRPSNIDAVLESTLEKYPFLKSTKKVSAPDTGTTNPGRQKNNSLTREAIANMSHDERVSRMDEISKWMQNGYK